MSEAQYAGGEQTSMKALRISKRSCYLLSGGALVLYLVVWFALPLAFSIPEIPVLESDSKTQGALVLKNYPSVEDQVVPRLMIEATLAAEDKRFYKHGGVDPFAICRAIYDSILAGRMVSGASTLSQQSIKLSRNFPPRTLKSKVIEAFAARHLEMRYSKDSILAYYFSKLEYGNRTLGPQSAALHYFNKSLSELEVHEAALLAGLPQAPSRHNPRRNPEGASERRAYVLERLHHTFDYPESVTSAPPKLQLHPR